MTIVLGIRVRAFRFGDHSDCLQVRFLREARDGRLEDVRLLTQLRGGGGLRRVNAEGAVVASGE
ncbi:hypothetical protein F2Q69_00008901 [Brassica cretica]|uniref:Uncharacterized protein n=1 Tax=Brassica cretica TaxID=69181 RepID=A0A8S9NWL4_BRACR|nr:hypothetical protein F2Q69_00008901 [Brassica cretica]